jgi:hypothetical protein
MGQVEEGGLICSVWASTVRVVSKDLGKGDGLANIVQTVLVFEDTKRDSEVVGTTVGADVVTLSVVVDVLGTFEEFEEVELSVVITHVFVEVRAVSVVVLADVAVAGEELLVDLVFAVVAKGTITALHVLALVSVTVDAVLDTVGVTVTATATGTDINVLAVLVVVSVLVLLLLVLVILVPLLVPLSAILVSTICVVCYERM